MVGIEMQDQDRVGASCATMLASLDWARATAVLQTSGAQAVDSVRLHTFVLALFRVDPNAALMGECAQIWSQELVVRSEFPLQVRLLQVLQNWLSARIGPALSEALAKSVSALTLELCEQYQNRRHDQDARQARLVLVGQLFASIAHELRNPLAVMESSVFLLRRQLHEDEGATRHLRKITRNVSRCHEIIHEVLEMIRDAPLRTQRLYAKDIWSDVQAHVPSEGEMEWKVDTASELQVNCEPRLLRQCLLNLVSNAQVAMQGRGQIECRATRDESGYVCFEVQDNGPGFSSETLAQGVQCLVTGHANGHGLGLALAQSIAQRHGGRLEISNRPSGGACVRVALPGSLPSAT